MFRAKLLLLVWVLCTVMYVWYLNSPPHDIGSEEYFAIQTGESFASVARRLQQQNLVRSALFIRFIARVTDQDMIVQSGNYNVPTGLNSYELIEFFTTGQQLLVKVSIPEGLTIRKIATILEQAGVTSAEEFISSAHARDIIVRYNIPADTLEGYLFPDTYYFPHNYSPEMIIAEMIERFRMTLNDIFPATTTFDSDELHRIVTLASIIEKEYLFAEDAPLISSVLYNRLAQNRRLEVCATIVYIITEIEGGELPSRIYFTDLERDSPYNTYRNRGLPPSPIANPGAVAIDAALNPADTNYLFFVLESENATRHKFSETLSEHSRARVIYLRSRE